jgi:hypothetical protein
VVEAANIAPVVVAVRCLGSEDLKSSAAVLYGFCLNKNAQGQSSPELNSQNEKLWNGSLWRKPVLGNLEFPSLPTTRTGSFGKIEVSVGPPRGSDKED